MELAKKDSLVSTYNATDMQFSLVVTTFYMYTFTCYVLDLDYGWSDTEMVY